MESKQFATGRNALRIFAALFLALALFLRFRPHPPPPPRPTSVRGPLKIILPPFTADRIQILAELRERKFAELDKQLTGYQREFEKDVTHEENVALAFDAFASTDATVGKLVDEWAKNSPSSFAAQFARARHLFSAGWVARGDKWASETSDEQFRKMKQLFQQASESTVAAIKLNPKLTVAYAALIDAAKSSNDGGAAMRTIAGAGLRQVPESFLIRESVMYALLPRWGGSYESMAKFTEDSQRFVKRNPRLAVFKGFLAWDRGAAAANNQHYAEAIALYNQAIDEGGDDFRFYNYRGGAYERLGMYLDALEDYSRANRLQPQNSATISYLASTEAQLRHPQETLRYIELYRQLTPPSNYLLSLEQWSQGRLGGTQRAAAVGGD